MFTVIGVDPGLVHSGVISIEVDSERRTFTTNQFLVDGVLDKGKRMVDVPRISTIVEGINYDAVFIEQYRPRSAFSADGAMLAAETLLRRDLPRAQVLSNSGVATVVTNELLKLLGLWKFNLVSHHQDLRSAARIGILGLLKNDDWNHQLYLLVNDTLQGEPWSLIHQ